MGSHACVGKTRQRAGFTLVELLTLVVVGALLIALLLPRLSKRPGNPKNRYCVNSLRQLGTYVVLYVSEYGSNRLYPPAAGEGFWNTLRNTPSPSEAIARGNDGLFVCRVLGTRPSPTALDYREPRGQVVDGLTQPQWPIACDRPTNHDPSGQSDMNVLFFSGSVRTVAHGAPEWDMAVQYTTDPK